MLKDILPLIISTIALIASFFSVLSWTKSINDIFDSSVKIKYIIASIIFAIIAILMAFQMPFNASVLPYSPPPGMFIDISGSYTGYIIDDYEKEIPTYLDLELDNQTDSIILNFKNDFSFTYKGKYFIKDSSIEIDKLGKGLVEQRNNYIIIKSEENQKMKWKFRKF